jgi:hypothetical protein
MNGRLVIGRSMKTLTSIEAISLLDALNHKALVAEYMVVCQSRAEFAQVRVRVEQAMLEGVVLFDRMEHIPGEPLSVVFRTGLQAPSLTSSNNAQTEKTPI